MPMVALTRFIVVTKQADAVDHIGQPILEPVDRTAHRPIESYDDLDKLSAEAGAELAGNRFIRATGTLPQFGN